MNIINAKFSPTTVEKAFIKRSELLKEMARDKNKKVIYVTAPAGYGKTTLLSQFSHMTDEKVVWYHLDSLDDEIVTFMTYLTEGISRCFGKHQEDIISISSDRLYQGDIKGPVADLLNYLSVNFKVPLCIVIDDYHYITKDVINEWLSIFVKYMPSNIRIIIASRMQPAINLDFLLTSNSLLEIDMSRLKFTTGEEKTFIENIKPNHQEIFNSVLIQKNNGWPFGLALLQYAINENIIGDYKIQELYKKCFDNIFDQFDDQKFLLSTCLLEILDIEACNYITSRVDSEGTLKKMYNRGLFISKTHSGGFKYHDLFKDYLRSKVKDKKGIYEKIGAYYICQKDSLEAIDYLLLSEDYDKADELLKQDQYRYVSIAYYIRIYHWDKKIPKKIALRYGSFSLIKALIALKNFDVQEGSIYIENAGTRFINQKDEGGILKTDIIWVKVLRMQGKFEEAYALANIIYDKIKTYSLDEKMDILSEKLYVGSFLNKVDEEFNVLKNETMYIDENNIKSYEVQALGLLEYAAYLIGEYRTAMSIQAKYRNKISPLNSIIYTIRIYMVWGHLEEGKVHIQREIDNAKHFGLIASLPELYGILAELEFHMGQYGQAEKYFKKSMELFEDKNHNLYHLCTFTYINMLSFLGRQDEAIRMIKRYYPLIPKNNHLGFMMVDMMLSQTYLILKDYDLAIEFANKAMIPSEVFGTKLYMATLNGVIATAFLAKGEIEKALNPARLAMDLSERGYYIQDFVTYYEVYTPLYELCISKGIQRAFVEEIRRSVNEVKQSKQEALIDKLYVKFFGDNIVKSGGKLLKWRTIKAKNIFFYLLYHQSTGVTKDKLMDTFFEHYDLDKANSNLRTSLTYIRKALLDVGFEDVIWQANGRYFVNVENILTDLVSFKQIMEQFNSAGANLSQLGKTLCEVYKGTFCEDIDVYELNLEKEKYYNHYQDALLRTVTYLKDINDYKEAINYMNVLIQHQRYNEAYYREKVKLYELMGDEVMMRRTEEELIQIRESM